MTNYQKNANVEAVYYDGTNLAEVREFTGSVVEETTNDSILVWLHGKNSESDWTKADRLFLAPFYSVYKVDGVLSDKPLREDILARTYGLKEAA